MLRVMERTLFPVANHNDAEKTQNAACPASIDSVCTRNSKRRHLISLRFNNQQALVDRERRRQPLITYQLLLLNSAMFIVLVRRCNCCKVNICCHRTAALSASSMPNRRWQRTSNCIITYRCRKWCRPTGASMRRRSSTDTSPGRNNHPLQHRHNHAITSYCIQKTETFIVSN